MQSNWSFLPVFSALLCALLAIGYVVQSHPDNVGSLVLVALLVTGAIGIYCLPTIIASQRNHSNLLAIAATNILLGWLVIGWIVALVWSLSDNIKAPEEA